MTNIPPFLSVIVYGSYNTVHSVQSCSTYPRSVCIPPHGPCDMDNQQVIFSSFFFTWTSFILVGRFAKVIRKRRNQRCEKFPTDCMFPESVSVNFETTKLCWKQNNVSKLKNVFPYENCDLKPN